MQINFSERELEDFLSTNNNLNKHFPYLRFVARQVNLNGKIIDMLAFDTCDKNWVIIELKKDMLNKDALIQGMGYLNHYKRISNYKDYSGRRRQFKLLFIGQNLEQSLHRSISYYSPEDNFSEDCEIFYSLFSLSLDKGIDFNYYHNIQRSVENSAREESIDLSRGCSIHRPIRYMSLPDDLEM